MGVASVGRGGDGGVCAPNRQLLKAWLLLFHLRCRLPSSARQTKSHKSRQTVRGRERERELEGQRVSEHDRQTNDTQTGKQANKKLRQKQQTNGQSSHMEAEEEDVDEVAA